MLLIILIGAICLYGLVSLIIAIKNAPLLNIDDDGFIEKPDDVLH